MPRYIDAEKLTDKVFPIGLVDNGQYTINAKAVKVAIDNIPTADVAEVVRCKDCKHWGYYCTDPIINYDYGNCNCRQWENAEFVPNTTSNDFCSYGERKEK